MAKRKKDRSRALIGLTLLAMPAALVTEQLIALFFLPPDLEIVRDHFAETLVPVGWALIGTTLASGIYATWAYRRSVRRAVERVGAGRRDATVERKKISLFLLYASLPQVPAIAVILGTLFGVPLSHAVVATLGSTAAILAMGWSRPSPSRR